MEQEIYDIANTNEEFAYNLGVNAAKESYNKDDLQLTLKSRSIGDKNPYRHSRPYGYTKNSNEPKWTRYEGTLAREFVAGWNQTWDALHLENLQSTGGQAFVIPGEYPERTLDWIVARYGEPVQIVNWKAAYKGDMLDARLKRTSKTNLFHLMELWPERREEVLELADNREELLLAAKKTITEMNRIIKALERK